MVDNDYFLGDEPQNSEEKIDMPNTATTPPEATMATEGRKKGMTLKTIPMSLKKIRKVIEIVRDRGTPITSEEKFDLEQAGSYLRYLTTTVDGMISTSK